MAFSRTVTTTICDCIGMNLETEQPVSLQVSLLGKYSTDDKLMKAVKKAVAGQNVVIAKINGVEIKKEIREISNEDFMAHSHVITR